MTSIISLTYVWSSFVESHGNDVARGPGRKLVASSYTRLRLSLLVTWRASVIYSARGAGLVYGASDDTGLGAVVGRCRLTGRLTLSC